MREDAELAARLENLPGDQLVRRCAGLARRRSLAVAIGPRAVHPLRVGARKGSMCNPSAELAALGYLALVAGEEGDWDAAGYETRATTRLAELGFGTNRRCLPMLLARAQLVSRGGDGDDAAADVNRLLDHMVPHPWMALLAQVVLGEVALVRGDRRRRRRPLPPRSSSGIPTRASCGAAPSACAAPSSSRACQSR